VNRGVPELFSVRRWLTMASTRGYFQSSQTAQILLKYCLYTLFSG